MFPQPTPKGVPFPFPFPFPFPEAASSDQTLQKAISIVEEQACTIDGQQYVPLSAVGNYAQRSKRRVLGAGRGRARSAATGAGCRAGQSEKRCHRCMCDSLGLLPCPQLCPASCHMCSTGSGPPMQVKGVLDWAVEVNELLPVVLGECREWKPTAVRPCNPAACLLACLLVWA